MDDLRQVICAYEVWETSDMPLEPAAMERDWMEGDDRFPYRCLPMVIANQSGWVIRNPVAFSAFWTGGLQRHDLVLSFGEESHSSGDHDGERRWQYSKDGDRVVFTRRPPKGDASQTSDQRISSQFGHGIITFSVPYLFRTPPGVNLWVKGPSNYIKQGAQALEGIVETDWSNAVFTMNWKLTTAGRWVHFAKGEPICMIVPMPRGYVESFEPQLASIGDDPELCEQFNAWLQSRRAFLEDLRNLREHAVKSRWEKDYFKGQTPLGAKFDGHQTKLVVKPFTRDCRQHVGVAK